MKVEAAERAEAKNQRLIDRALDAHMNNEKWPPKAKRNLTPEQKKLVDRMAHERAALSKEIGVLNDIPLKPATEETPPAKGELFEKVMSEKIREQLPPMRRKLLIVLAAYADGDNHSPPIDNVAARMATTRPNVVWLLHALEQTGWVEIKWAKKPHLSNVYTLKIH